MQVKTYCTGCDQGDHVPADCGYNPANQGWPCPDSYPPESVTADNTLRVHAAVPAMQVNDIVIFSPRTGENAEGIVTRVWDKPASDPYVTVQTINEPTPRTFTRFASALRMAEPCATYALHDAGKCECAGIYWTDTKAAEIAQASRIGA